MPRNRARSVIALLLTASCGVITDPDHEPIKGAVVAGYYQTVIAGEPTSEVVKKSTTSYMVIQYSGTLCLFEGGAYSYVADYWYYNSMAKKGNADNEGLKYGTYTGDPASSVTLEGRVSGFAPIVGDTLTVGNDAFQKSTNVATKCETMR
jgi:hypothetical protein